MPGTHDGETEACHCGITVHGKILESLQTSPRGVNGRFHGNGEQVLSTPPVELTDEVTLAPSFEALVVKGLIL